MLSAETFNNTADVTSYIELIAVMEAISNMDMKKHLEAFRSLNIGQAQIKSYRKAVNRLSILITVILTPLCGIAIIFFFSKFLPTTNVKPLL